MKRTLAAAITLIAAIAMTSPVLGAQTRAGRAVPSMEVYQAPT